MKHSEGRLEKLQKVVILKLCHNSPPTWSFTNCFSFHLYCMVFPYPTRRGWKYPVSFTFVYDEASWFFFKLFLKKIETNIEK